jgi:hypothetical protein
MALQTSGAISLAQVQTEFDGANPIGMNEYYKNGSYVPSTVGSAAGSWSGFFGHAYTYFWQTGGGYPTTIKWDNVQKASGSYGTTVTAGGYQYEKGTLFTTLELPGDPITYYYRVRRRVAASSTSVNTSVPASGTISMSNFYGGRNT